MRIRRVLITSAVTGLLALTASPALAQQQGQQGEEPVKFFTGGQGTAGWVHFSPPPVGDPDDWSIQLTVPDSTSFAGAELVDVAGPPPPNAPSFDFRTNLTGASGGSPRLVMLFSDGGKGELRPLVWTAGVWQRPGQTDWDNNGGPAPLPGGTCGFRYEVTYQVMLACHPGAMVTSVFVVTDSGWLHPGGYTNWIDNISYGGHFITRPEDQEDEEDEENGEHGNGGHEKGN